MRTLEFFFDVVSPYSYLCGTQIDGVGKKHGATVRWRPFLLGAVFKTVGNETPARIPSKAKWMLGDLKMWASYYDVAFTFPPEFPVNTLRAMRACAAAESSGKVREVARSLFASYWVHGATPSSDEAIRGAATAAGLDPEALLAAIEAQPAKDGLRANTDEAVARGAFGAPAVFVGEALFWGNDRFLLLDRFLASQP